MILNTGLQAHLSLDLRALFRAELGEGQSRLVAAHLSLDLPALFRLMCHCTRLLFAPAAQLPYNRHALGDVECA